MKIYPYSLRTFGGRRICIGKQGENLATRIDVDVTPWKTEYPTGNISLFVVPPVGSGYLAAIEVHENTVRWPIRDTDTAYDGSGKAELILKDADGTVIKSVTAYTTCTPSVSATEPSDPPEAIRPWVEQILDAIASGALAGIGIESLEQTTISTDDSGINIWTATLTDGSTYQFEVRNGQRGADGAPGEKGEKGDTGPQGPQGEPGSIESLTINGKTPDDSGTVTLTPGDLGAASAESVNQLKDDLVDLEDSVITVEKTPNMVNDDTSTWVQGTPDGVFDFCVMTNAIDVSEYKTIMLGWNSPLSYSIENVRLWHLDSNMIKIGNSYPVKETAITLDDDVKYVKIGLATGGTLLNPSMIDCKTLGLWLVYGSTPLSSWEPYEISHNNIEENRENISKNTISINTLFDLIVNGGNLLSLDSFNTINEDRYESRKKYTFLNSFKKAFSFEKGILTTPHSTSGTKFAIFADTQFDEGNPTSTFWKTSGTVGDYTNAVNTFKYLDTLNLDFASIIGDVINDGYQSELQYAQLSIFDEIVKNIKNYPLMTYRGNHDPKVSRFSNKGLIACNGVNLWFAQADYVGDAHHSCGTMTLDYISWLESEISKHSDEINIVCGHYPINTDEFPMLDDFTDDSGTERHGHRAEFVAMLNRVGVKLYLSGHLHHTNWRAYTKDGVTNIDCGAGFDSYAICNVSSSGLFTMDVYNTTDNTRRASISTISVQL